MPSPSRDSDIPRPTRVRWCHGAAGCAARVPLVAAGQGLWCWRGGLPPTTAVGGCGLQPGAASSHVRGHHSARHARYRPVRRAAGAECEHGAAEVAAHARPLRGDTRGFAAVWGAEAA